MRKFFCERIEAWYSYVLKECGRLTGELSARFQANEPAPGSVLVVPSLQRRHWVRRIISSSAPSMSSNQGKRGGVLALLLRGSPGEESHFGPTGE